LLEDVALRIAVALFLELLMGGLLNEVHGERGIDE
jgi:hypothetical protein